MNSWISNTAKKEFIESLLLHYRLRNADTRRILEIFLASPQHLTNLHFSELVHPNERTIEISTTCSSNHVPFIYHKPQSVPSYNISETYQSLTQNPKVPTYLILHFRGKQLNFKYQAFVKAPTLKVKEAIHNKQWSNLIIQYSLMEAKVDQINRRIDETLLNGDKDTFIRLAEERRKLKADLETLLALKERKEKYM